MYQAHTRIHTQLGQTSVTANGAHMTPQTHGMIGPLPLHQTAGAAGTIQALIPTDLGAADMIPARIQTALEILGTTLASQALLGVTDTT